MNTNMLYDPQLTDRTSFLQHRSWLAQQRYGVALSACSSRLYPAGARDYFLTVAKVSVTFGVDAAGKATEMVLHQSGHDVAAKRVR